MTVMLLLITDACVSLCDVILHVSIQSDTLIHTRHTEHSPLASGKRDDYDDRNLSDCGQVSNGAIDSVIPQSLHCKAATRFACYKHLTSKRRHCDVGCLPGLNETVYIYRWLTISS